MHLDDINNVFLKYMNVVSMLIETKRSGYDLVLELESNNNEFIKILFCNVSQLNIANFGGGLCQFNEMLAYDVSRDQIDRMNYKIENNDLDISFLCSDFLIF